MLQTYLDKAKSKATPSNVTSNDYVVDIIFSLISLNSDTWIVYSKATTHICFSKQQFISLKPTINVTVSFPNHTWISIQFIGNVQVNDSLILHDVLFVPSFSFNLISLSSLTTQMPIMINFVGDYCVLQDKSSLKTIDKANKWNGPYLLDSSIFK